MTGESGKIIRNIFGKSYKEGESIFKDASKGALDFKSPNENTFYGKKGGKKFAEYEVKENLYDSKITYFSFINSINNIPISGLEIVIKDSKGNISRQNTNSKGIIEIENHYSSPFTLLNIKHKEVNKPTEKTQINALYNFTDCYTFEKYEPKEISYIKEIKKLNSVKTIKVLLPHAKIKVESGDNLEQYLSASEIKNFDKLIRRDFFTILIGNLELKILTMISILEEKEKYLYQLSTMILKIWLKTNVTYFISPIISAHHLDKKQLRI